jgi:hypothetical protein
VAPPTQAAAKCSIADIEGRWLVRIETQNYDRDAANGVCMVADCRTEALLTATSDCEMWIRRDPAPGIAAIEFRCEQISRPINAALALPFELADGADRALLEIHRVGRPCHWALDDGFAVFSLTFSENGNDVLGDGGTPDQGEAWHQHLISGFKVLGTSVRQGAARRVR